MPEKLLTLEELSSYLGISEAKIVALMDEGVLSAYKIGGEFLRFRKEQIDAVYSEIMSSVQDSDKVVKNDVRNKVKERLNMVREHRRGSFAETFADFFYFYDFYIISFLIIGVLVYFIYRSLLN